MVLRSGCAFGGDFSAKQGKVATTGSSRATAFFYLSLSSRVSTQLNRGALAPGPCWRRGWLFFLCWHVSMKICAEAGNELTAAVVKLLQHSKAISAATMRACFSASERPRKRGLGRVTPTR